MVLAATKTKRLLELGVGRCYRLDLIETNPRWRGLGVGNFMMHVLAGRAIEAGADCLLLASVPEAISFYERLGGAPGKVRGWNVRPDLTPFLFEAEVLGSMWESING